MQIVANMHIVHMVVVVLHTQLHSHLVGVFASRVFAAPLRLRIVVYPRDIRLYPFYFPAHTRAPRIVEPLVKPAVAAYTVGFDIIGRSANHIRILIREIGVVYELEINISVFVLVDILAHNLDKTRERVGRPIPVDIEVRKLETLAI